MLNLNLPLHSILIGILLIPSAVVKDLQCGLQHGLPHETRTVPTTSTLAVAQKSTNADWYNNTFPFLFTRAFAITIVFALGLPHWPLNRLCFVARFDCHNNLLECEINKSFSLLFKMWLVFIFGFVVASACR